MSEEPNPYASPRTVDRGVRTIKGDAKLLADGFLMRRVRLAGDEEVVIEYNARGLGFDTVRVNDRVAARRWTWWWFAPRFDFAITVRGAKLPVVLTVEIGPTLAITQLTIEVDDRVVYDETS